MMDIKTIKKVIKKHEFYIYQTWNQIDSAFGWKHNDISNAGQVMRSLIQVSIPSVSGCRQQVDLIYSFKVQMNMYKSKWPKKKKFSKSQQTRVAKLRLRHNYRGSDVVPDTGVNNLTSHARGTQRHYVSLPQCTNSGKCNVKCTGGCSRWGRRRLRVKVGSSP